MELSSEDSFRLNVLLANRPQAIRIDESRLIVYALAEQGEAKVRLNPTGRPEQYLRAVRELISGHVLGSPGGYPVYLRRWTRMGQMRDQSLEQLLLLGEPEAVVAAAGAPGLTETLARRAWWAMEDAENARRMLRNPNIIASTMGPILAGYLVEYLPFETESERIIESVRLVLQPGLLAVETRLALWQKAARKPAYLVGFLHALPHDLPQPLPARDDLQQRQQPLGALLQAADNPPARLLLQSASAAGQTFLATLATVLAKPPNQEIITALFEVLRAYFAELRPHGDPDLPIAALQADSRAFIDPDRADPAVRACLAASPTAADELAAMRLLSGVGYGLLRPLLPDPTTAGTLMRRRLGPATNPLLDAVACLRGEPQPQPARGSR
ncbi:MAG: sulfur reduction protein DsrS [Chromatiaceae bacterium]|nr:MAG: sulfur reduction protein DsrS [Chromatiaceae bacterium]